MHLERLQEARLACQPDARLAQRDLLVDLVNKLDGIDDAACLDCLCYKLVADGLRDLIEKLDKES